MADVTIEARTNGPYVVTGTIELRDTDGNVLPTQTRVVLCRCDEVVAGSIGVPLASRV